MVGGYQKQGKTLENYHPSCSLGSIIMVLRGKKKSKKQF
jgi:hypothetical protein